MATHESGYPVEAARFAFVAQVIPDPRGALPRHCLHAGLRCDGVAADCRGRGNSVDDPSTVAATQKISWQCSIIRYLILTLVRKNTAASLKKSRSGPGELASELVITSSRGLPALERSWCPQRPIPGTSGSADSYRHRDHTSFGSPSHQWIAPTVPPRA
jgi:hypothetical protein